MLLGLLPMGVNGDGSLGVKQSLGTAMSPSNTAQSLGVPYPQAQQTHWDPLHIFGCPDAQTFQN